MLFHTGKFKLLVALFAIALILASCSRNEIAEQSPVIQQKIVIDWVDFLKINTISYTGSQDQALTDPSKLGEEIGKVTFQIADVVHDPHYIVKDGGYLRLLDSVGDRIIAEGADRSILDISISTGKVQHYPINGNLDALSLDGQYVLYRKMIDDSSVGNEIAAFDLTSEKSIDLGLMEKNYVFAQGVK